MKTRRPAKQNRAIYSAVDRKSSELGEFTERMICRALKKNRVTVRNAIEKYRRAGKLEVVRKEKIGRGRPVNVFRRVE